MKDFKEEFPKAPILGGGLTQIGGLGLPYSSFLVRPKKRFLGRRSFGRELFFWDITVGKLRFLGFRAIGIWFWGSLKNMEVHNSYCWSFGVKTLEGASGEFLGQKGVSLLFPQGPFWVGVHTKSVFLLDFGRSP